MPFDPTEVRSRDELLMGAIATGDSTVIGDPRDRNEEFIKAIADGIGSAGGHLYRHRIKVKATILSYTFVFNLDLLNYNSEDYTDFTAIKNDIDHLVDFHFTTGALQNITGVNFYDIYLASNSLRIRYGYLSQDNDTKDITYNISNSDLEYISQSTTLL